MKRDPNAQYHSMTDEEYHNIRTGDRVIFLDTYVKGNTYYPPTLTEGTVTKKSMPETTPRRLYVLWDDYIVPVMHRRTHEERMDCAYNQARLGILSKAPTIPEEPPETEAHKRKRNKLWEEL